MGTGCCTTQSKSGVGFVSPRNATASPVGDPHIHGGNA